MKVLFLDVDGVLNSYKSGGMYALKKPCLKRLQRIVEETDCKIVLSSSWRKIPDALKRLKRVLSYRGLEIYDTTPVLHNEIRGSEISDWWDSHCDEGDIFAILDDDSDMLNYQLPHFFQTDPEYGLTDTITYRVVFHLNKV